MENEYLQRFIACLNMVKCDKKGEFITYEDTIRFLLDTLVTLRKTQNKVFFIGNGGSAAIAMHMTTDYLKNGEVWTHSMYDPTTLTCLGNDYGYEHIFDKQIEIVARSEDVLVAISSSGNSPNIVNAVNMAREKFCRIITLSGFREDNTVRQMGDYNIYVPSMEYGIVESIHTVILQQIVDILKERNQEA